jgi:small nuclear ribonucleoprotein (snRNP)-like protein
MFWKPCMSRVFVGAVLGLVLCVAAAQAEADKEGKEVTGTVKKVDATAKIIILTVDGKDRRVEVSKTTKFFGPNGGVSKDGIKDDRLVKGAEITVLLATNNKTAREIKLPRRKKETDK